MTLMLVSMAVVAILGMPRAVLAHAGHDHAAEAKTEAAAQKTTRQENFKKVCEARRQGLKQRLETIARHPRRDAKTLQTITDRVDAFVVAKKVPLADYEALKTSLTLQQQKVQETQAATDAAIAAFSCETGSAKDSLAAIKIALQHEITALKSYKTSVKDFIAAAKEGSRS